MSRDEGFLSRWNRRKAEARHTPEEAPAALVETPPEVPSALGPAEAGAPPAVPDMLSDDPPDEETREAWVKKLEAVDLEALSFEDDFTIFLKGWVPQALRNRALRRLWRTDDVFAVLDGLNDYDEDYTIAPAAVGSIKSSWQPGRGFAKAEELIAKAGAEPDPAEDEARDAAAEPPDEASATVAPQEASGEPGDSPEAKPAPAATVENDPSEAGDEKPNA
jgi:hypothetical protein